MRNCNDWNRLLRKASAWSLSLAVTILAAHAPAKAEDIVADVLLRGGQIVDGTGASIRTGDVAIADGKILTPGDEDVVSATWSIDCTGLIICPGFIDLHNHSDGEIERAATRSAVNYITQGCTTMVTGNCGSGPVDVAKYYEKIDQHGAGTNIAHLIPQGNLRKRVLDSDRIEPTDAQLEEMRLLADQAMRDGAWGMSTGLIYVPSSFASTEEITEIAKVVAKHRGIYASHIRGEGTSLLESVDEALKIGREADVPVHISHFKSSGRAAWGLVREAARVIAAERLRGRSVTADQYPYIASSTSLGATVLPSWAREGGKADLNKRFDDDSKRMRELIAKALRSADDGKSIRIANYKANSKWVGQNLAAIAKSENRPILEIAIEILRNGGASVVKFSMSEEDVRHIMAIDWVATASDGSAKLPGANKPHPRNYGTFPRKLAYYSLQEKVIPLEQAIRSMTGLPAKILSMSDRGLIDDGMAADITVFDPKTLRDTATFDAPHQYAEGIRYVFVNGQPALVNGKCTGTLAGKALRYSPATSTETKPDKPAGESKKLSPLMQVVDLSIGESQSVQLNDGTQVTVKLIELREQRDSISEAVRRAEVTVEVDGKRVQLVSATYNLPKMVGNVQIDCSVTSGYNSNGRSSSWGLEKDARLRLWPADSPWIRPETFSYPARQRWFATHTQMANQPTYVDGGDQPSRKTIYYHSGLDIGGTEGHTEVIAATDGLVVSAGVEVLPEHKNDTPVSPRYDVVYIQDARGWYYRYSHLKEIDEQIKPGRVISMRDRIGLLGKEGGSGGWTHLHFEIKSRQPSGQWGTQAGYAFLWQAYLREHDPAIIAVARPHHFLQTGESAELDASKSWSRAGGNLKYEWSLHDGTSAQGPRLTRKYETAGTFSEVVKVSDGAGNIAYDFGIVQVVDRDTPHQLPPTIHPTYSPTFGIRPGDPIRFTVRSFRTTAGKETWDFGDDGPVVEVESDGNRDKLSPDGYAVTSHRFEKPGDYIVGVERTNEFGLTATGHVHVRVEAAQPREVQVNKDVSYLGDDREEKMDLYLPTENHGGPRPAVLIIHGGGWTGGDKAAGREQNIGNTLAKAGYVCASINYVLANEDDRLDRRLKQVWPKNLHDCKRAVRFLRKNAKQYNIDPDRIGAIGGSAGGHLVSLLATTNADDGLDPADADDISCRIQAVVPMYGVHDVLQQAKVRETFSVMNESERELCRRASPITYLSSDDPPALILHGTKDQLVPVEQSQILHDQLQKAGVQTQLHIIENAPHSFHLQP
ncbi:MAG: amidohydrolase family protein, partial [Rubripirellula sp.]